MKRPLATFTVAAAVLAAVARPSEAAPAAAPLPVPEWSAPAPESRTLANGLRVVVFQDHRLPVVQVQLRTAAGTRYEPDQRPGVASLTGQLLRAGTSSRSAQQFTADLEALGAVFGVSVLRDVALANTGFRASDLDAGLELLADAVTSPIFEDESFETARRQAASQLGQQMQSLNGIAEERVQESAFGAHPYGRPALGSIDGLLQLGVQDVQRFHRERWRPDRAVLALAGDVTPAAAFQAAERWFSRWGGRSSEDQRDLVPAPVPVRVVDVAEAPYTEVRVAVVGPGRRSADHVLWSLAPALLEVSGLPAGARAEMITHLDASLLVLAQPARTDSAAFVAQRLRDAIAAAATVTASPAWTARRAREANASILALETLGARLTQWAIDDAAGLSADAARRAADAMRSADVAPLQQALRGPMSVLAVGPAQRLSGALSRFGAVDVQPLARMLTAAPVDTLPAATAEESRLGRAAITAAIAAHGGLRALQSVTTMLADGELMMGAEGRELSSQFSSVRAPGRFVYMNKLFDFESRQVLDRGRGWALSIADTASLVELDSLALAQLEVSRESDLVSVLLAASRPSARPALRGRELIEGREADLVDLHTRHGVLRLVLDARTRRVLAIDGGLSRQVFLERRRLRDFKLVRGLLLPHDEERFIEGQSVSRIRTTRLELGAPIDEQLFVRPEVRGGRLIGR